MTEAKFINGGKRIGKIDTPKERQDMAMRLAPMFQSAAWRWAVKCPPGTSVDEWKSRQKTPDASTILIAITGHVNSLSAFDGDWSASGGLCVGREDGSIWLEVANELAEQERAECLN